MPSAEADMGFLAQVASQIAIAVENALEYGQITQAKERLAEQKLYLEDEIRIEQNFEEIIGNSQSLKAVLESVRIVAPADSTALIQGETGTQGDDRSRDSQPGPPQGSRICKGELRRHPSGPS